MGQLARQQPTHTRAATGRQHIGTDLTKPRGRLGRSQTRPGSRANGAHASTLRTRTLARARSSDPNRGPGDDGASLPPSVATSLMEQHEVRRLSVIEQRHLVGMTSEADLATHLPEQRVAQYAGVVHSAPPNL
jgi:hypothetical protein